MHNVGKTVFWISLFGLFLCSCNRESSTTTGEYNPAYCEDSAMAHFISQPERALELIDSAVIVKQMLPEHGKYCSAIVVYNGLKKPDSCIVMCKDILTNAMWKNISDERDALKYHIDVLNLMTCAAMSIGDNYSVIRYAREGLELTNGRKDKAGDEADFLARLGLSLYEVGELDEGLKTLYKALRLTKQGSDWSSLLAYFNASKKLSHVLTMENRYDEACTVAIEALNHLYAFRRTPQSTKHVPAAVLKDSSSVNEFVQYYETPLLASVTKCYAKMNQLDSTRVWYEHFIQSGQSDNPAVSQSIIYPLIVLGEYTQAKERIAQTRTFLGEDTISASYITLLEFEKNISTRTGDTEQALALAERILHITDSLNTHEYHQALANASSQYKLYEEQLKRKDSETRLLFLTVSVLAVAALLIVILSVIYIRRMYFKREQLNDKLEQAQTEIKTLKKKSTEHVEVKVQTVQLDELYLRAVAIMEKFKPYTDSNFDMQTLSTLLLSNRSYLSNAINQQSGLSFRNWVAKYRVECAKEILTREPEITMDSLASQCGFDDRSSLYRQFKNLEGKLPKKWLEETSNGSTLEPKVNLQISDNQPL